MVLESRIMNSNGLRNSTERLLIIAGSILVAYLATSPLIRAQSTPFLTDDEIRMLINEISGDRAFEHIRALSAWHRNSGMEGYFKAADYVLEEARKAGLEDVRFVEQPLPGRNYTARSAELWMLEPIELKLADIGDHALSLSDGSHDADVTAELVWVGSGRADEAVVKGKIVLTNGSPGDAVREFVWGKGALGVIAYPTSEGKSPFDYPDQIAWTRISMTPPEGKEGAFAFALSPRRGDALRRLLETDGKQDIFATGRSVPGGRIVVQARVDTEIGDANPGRTGFVEGWIRGSRYHDEQIVITAHLQEEQGSANDDGSGCGNILELARVFNKLIEEGKISRPLRDIRFWWTDEIYSEYRYFADNPEEPRKFLANIHEDMVGARQSLGSRVQHLIFAPHSRTSYLDAVFESIGTFLKQTNNSFLASGRMGGQPRPHSRAIYSTRGSREGYNATFVPHFGSSDHICFLDAQIGVPAVALINWDDDFIHSSDDDLDTIDPTQLKRNAFLVGAIGYVLAFAEADDIPVFLSETYSQGSRRLGNDLAVALRTLSQGDGETRGWKDAVMMVEQGLSRERGALESIRVFSQGDSKAEAPIDRMVGRRKAQRSELLSELTAFYVSVNGVQPPEIKLEPPELEASKKVPSNISSIKDYFAKRRRVRGGSGLHGLMRSELYRFVDGERSYYDIYEALRAEAQAAGSWYYGKVELKDVVELLDAAVDAGVLELR